MPARHRAELRGGLHRASGIGQVRERQQARARRDRGLECLRAQQSFGIGRHHLHHDAVRLLQPAPWQQVAQHLGVGHQHFIAGLPGDAARGDGNALGGVLGEGDLVGRAVEQPGQLAAHGFHACIGLPAERRQVDADMAGVEQVAAHGVEHGVGRNRGRGRVEIDGGSRQRSVGADCLDIHGTSRVMTGGARRARPEVWLTSSAW
ncbi:hypothetical protein D3C81_1356600 [compost metagenome]